MTLTDFLLARMAEDEIRRGLWERVNDQLRLHDYRAIHVRLRREREHEAKRLIVELHSRQFGQFGVDPCDAHDGATMESTDCETLRLLGTAYAAHPDYRDEWRPR